MTKFNEFGLSNAVLRSISHIGYETPTPIQEQAIPVVLDGEDILGLAQTGTGKTAAFGLPLIHNLLKADQRPQSRQTQALIVAPTRELVQQIGTNLREFTRRTPLRVDMVVGGASIHMQKRKLERGTHILVATPGRLMDLVERKALFIDSAKFLVLDEADQMLDLGFIHTLRKIAKLVGRPRQTLMFSATMPKQIDELANSFLEDPVRIEIARSGDVAEKITQSVHFVSQRSKSELLRKCLSETDDGLSLVFSRTKHGAEKLMKRLVEWGFSANSVHGNKSQGQRERAIRAFKNGDIQILVATDVAARGIDIPGVKYVYNFDLPEVAENYVHRIGRTARAGREGEAIAFCAEAEVHLLDSIEKLMSLKVEVVGGDRPQRSKPASRRRNSGGRDRKKITRGNNSRKPSGFHRKNETDGEKSETDSLEAIMREGGQYQARRKSNHRRNRAQSGPERQKLSKNAGNEGKERSGSKPHKNKNRKRNAKRKHRNAALV